MQKSQATEFAVVNFQGLEIQLQSCMDYIPFVEGNEDVVSPKFIPIIMEACSLIDSIFKHMASEPAERNNLKKYSDMYESVLSLEENISLFLGSPIRALTPFAEWTKHQPEWWGAYNALKHDRLRNDNAATFNNAVMALGGLHQVMVRCKAFIGPFLRAGWIDTTEIETLVDLGSVAHLGSLHPSPPSLVVESLLFVSPTRENFVRSFDGFYFDIDYDMKGISKRIRNLLSAHEDW